MSTFEEAIKAFDAIEANLSKLENLWKAIVKFIPDGICFGIDDEDVYDDKCRDFESISSALPAISGWRMPICLFSINEIAQMRLDAEEIGEIEAKVSVHEAIFEQEKHFKKYQYRTRRKRRELVRENLLQLVAETDEIIRAISAKHPDTRNEPNEKIEDTEWLLMKEKISKIDFLLGSDIERPSRWQELRRHVVFAMPCDLTDIINFDWPDVKQGITESVFGDSDAIPAGVSDIGELVASKPQGDIPSKLKWEKLSPEGFERLLFALISNAKGYEKPEWLMHTNTPDKGRDLSVLRVVNDPLGSLQNIRVIIQCKHRTSTGISISEITTAKEQVKLWEPPRIDVLIFATTGRFTADAVSYVEKNNQSDSALRIEMWPESHLERLLANRPGMVAEFKLR